MGFFRKNKSVAPQAEVATPEVKKAPATVKTPVVSGSVILRPLVTEKSAVLASKNMYTFVVEKHANRLQVASAIKAMYDVLPISVNVQQVRGKVVRRGRISGTRKGWKKAIVTLPKGKTLNVYEGV